MPSYDLIIKFYIFILLIIRIENWKFWRSNWKSFTFYDDEYNIMLPSEISENECSLIENQLKVISLQINIENKSYKFIKMRIKVCKI